jgi:hypothetical protein
MMTMRSIGAGAFSLLLLTVGYATASSSGSPRGVDDEGLVGAWRSRVQFTSGAFASVKDLELMYAFNAGGTMTESSNYDGSPPVPPAYGVWRKVAAGQYEARYSFYVTKAPKAFDDIAKGGDWSPGGIGVIVEKLALAGDGKTYTSTLRVDVFDETGKLVESGSEAFGRGSRMSF